MANNQPFVVSHDLLKKVNPKTDDDKVRQPLLLKKTILYKLFLSEGAGWFRNRH